MKDPYSLNTTTFISILRKYQAIKDGHNGCHSKFWWKLWAFQTSQKQYAGSWTLCGLSGLQSWTMSWWVPLQVILCQINIFWHQLTQNITTVFFRFTNIYTDCIVPKFKTYFLNFRSMSFILGSWSVDL